MTNKYRRSSKGWLAYAAEAISARLWPALVLTLVFVWDAGVLVVTAYENDNSQRTMADGPHRIINGLALKRLLASKDAHPLFARYEFAKLPVLRGEGVVRPGWVHFDTAYSAGEREGSYIWWIKEGGYTADEPELYASFRHFYDPKAINGKTFLTDHLETIDWYYQLLSNRVSKKMLGQTFYPQVDAREWAIAGPEKEGFGRNEYAWDRGLESMREAFSATDPIEKGRLFVKAWRALGETMHLVADMTSPAHVRNDSHPGLAMGAFGLGETNTDVGLLKADPYESYASHRLVMQYAGGEVESALEQQIHGAKDPWQLFDVVATYTQDNFFTPDTISGADRLGRGVTNANGQRGYPSPKLNPKDFQADEGYYVKTVNDRPIRMAHESWLLSTGWGSPKHAVQMTYPCVQDQASVLIPVAVKAAMKLADWYIPKIEVQLDSFDATKGVLKGRVIHRNSDSAYSNPLLFNASDPPAFHLYIDGGLQDWAKIKLQVVQGEITADLSKLNVPEKAKLALVLDVGGMRVRSQELELGEESVLTYLQKTSSVQFRLRGIYALNSGGIEEHNEEQAFNRRDPEIQQWSWNGNSFDITWKKNYTGYSGMWEGAVRTIRFSGTVSPDGRTLSSCSFISETAFRDGPRRVEARLSGLPAKILMPEATRPWFVCSYRGDGPGIATCVIKSQTGTYRSESTLTDSGSEKAPKAEVEFFQ